MASVQARCFMSGVSSGKGVETPDVPEGTRRGGNQAVQSPFGGTLTLRRLPQRCLFRMSPSTCFVVAESAQSSEGWVAFPMWVVTSQRLRPPWPSSPMRFKLIMQYPRFVRARLVSKVTDAGVSKAWLGWRVGNVPAGHRLATRRTPHPAPRRSGARHRLDPRRER